MVIGITKVGLILWISKIRGPGLRDIRSRLRVGMRYLAEIGEIKGSICTINCETFTYLDLLPDCQ